MARHYWEAFEAVEEIELPSDRPVASAVWGRLVSVPIIPTMSGVEVGHVTAIVRDLCARFAWVAASARRGRS